MSEHIGGKGSGASSSSEFLRAYRIGVLAGANASYQNIPKKSALSYATATDLLESRNKRGVLADLSGMIATDCKCPTKYTGPHTPLVYVSTNIFASLPVNGDCLITSINTGELYCVNSFLSPNILCSVKPFRQILTGLGTGTTGLTQSLIDGNIYMVDAFLDTFISYTIGQIGTTVISNSLFHNAFGGIAQDNSGNFYMVGQSGIIIKVTLPDTVIELSRLTTGLTGVTYASDGNLYASTSSTTGGIYQISTDGTSAIRIPFNNNVPYGYLSSLIQANDEYLYICGPNNTITRMNLSGEQISTFTTLSGMDTDRIPYSITQGINENLYVSDSNTIYEIVVR